MQKRILKQLKRGTALVAAFALTVSGITVADVKAASKTPTLSEKKISIKKGESKNVKVEKKKNVTVKKVTWNIESGKKVVKLTKETKTYVTIKGLKKGTATVSAKIKVGKKTYTREVNVTVKAATPATTKAPATKVPATKAPATKTPDPTKAPVVTDASKPTDAPVITDAPKPTDAPVATKAPDATATAVPTTPSKATATPYPYITAQPDPTAVPDELDGVATKKDSWHKGMISSLSGIYAGKKIKISLQVREVGVKNPTGQVTISANYNGYPNFATIDLSNEWQTVEIVHRFGEFTNQWSSMYFTGNDVTDDMTMYIKNLSFEVLDEGDPLGGTVLQKSNWHKGVLGSLTKATHENKEIKISFSIRESGVENPTGTFFVQSNHYAGEYPKLKEDIPLTTDWTEVSFTYVIGEITNDYPSIYLNGDAITDDMEMFMKDFKIEVIGDAPTSEKPGTPENPEPFASVDIKGAPQWTSVGEATYIVGEKCPTGFDIVFTATEGSSINLEISTTDGKTCNYGVGTGRSMSCDLSKSHWGDNPIGTSVASGSAITIKAIAAQPNEVADFEFTSIIPTGGAFEPIDLSGISSYKYTGTPSGYQKVFISDAIGSSLKGTLAEYSKVVIDYENNTGKTLNFSIVAADNETDAFVKYEPGSGTFEILLSNTSFNPPGAYQTVYNTVEDALALSVADVRLKVTARDVGTKGSFVIKSVTFVK